MKSGKHHIKTCKFCERRFIAHREWQVFCCPEHKKAFEKIITDLFSDCRSHFVGAAEKLSQARLDTFKSDLIEWCLEYAKEEDVDIYCVIAKIDESTDDETMAWASSFPFNAETEHLEVSK